MDKRKIELPDGGTLEVDCTPEFYQVIRKSLNVYGREINDKDVKDFIYEAFKNGIEKAEKDLKEKEQLTQDDE